MTAPQGKLVDMENIDLTDYDQGKRTPKSSRAKNNQ